MKKVLSMILMAAMVLTMVCGMAACGDNAEDATSKPAAASQAAPVVSQAAPEPADDVADDLAALDVFMTTALANVPAYEVADLSATTWKFAGGMVDGVEMEQEDADALLAACGGVFQFQFVDDTSLQMVNGAQSFDGTYTVIGDNDVIYATFDNYTYYGVLTVVGETTVLVLSSVDAPGTALYMSLVE